MVDPADRRGQLIKLLDDAMTIAKEFYSLSTIMASALRPQSQTNLASKILM
jgi:hypothetical protein